MVDVFCPFFDFFLIFFTVQFDHFLTLTFPVDFF